jgi:hypothetical protein
VVIAEKSLHVAVRNIARALGDEIGEENHCSIPGSRRDRGLASRSPPWAEPP